MSDTIKLKYRWRATWPDQAIDFVGCDGRIQIGRIYEHRAAQGMFWYWHMGWGDNDRERVNLSGLCSEPREAAREIERSYDKLRDFYSPAGSGSSS